MVLEEPKNGNNMDGITESAVQHIEPGTDMDIFHRVVGLYMARE